jgi:hypothetical protein
MLPLLRTNLGPRSARRAADVSRGEVVKGNARTRRAGRAIRGRPAELCILACLPVLAGCQYVDNARAASDAVVSVSEYYKVEALVQADIERRRLRKARCYSPLLTPATISAAAIDGRLGAGWIDELLGDCPQFAAFLSELTFRRGLSAGLLPARDRPAAENGAKDQSAAQATAPHSAIEGQPPGAPPAGKP